MGFKLYSLYNLTIYRQIPTFNNLLDREIPIHFIYFSFFVVFEKRFILQPTKNPTFYANIFFNHK